MDRARQLLSVLTVQFLIWLSFLRALLFSKHFKYEPTINTTVNKEKLTLIKHQFVKFKKLYLKLLSLIDPSECGNSHLE